MTSVATLPETGHTRRLIGMRLLPFLFLLYIVNYIDRTNLAYAALGMSRDLGFGDRVFGLGAGIFFLSYVALQIPGARLVDRWSARRMICLTMVAWGLLTALTALVHTPIQLYLVRFALGAAEASFFPGVIVYLSHWFIQEDRAKATSKFMCAIPLSSVVGSALAGWILGHTWMGLHGWRWLFVVEGLPAILSGIIALFYLTDRPRQATWLTPDQRQYIEDKLQQENPEGKQGITLLQALRSRIILLLAAVTFLSYVAMYSFLFWFPTMLKRQSGFSDLNVGLIGALPYFVTFLVMQINGWHSDKRRERRWHTAVPLLVAAGALLGLLAHPTSINVWIALFVIVSVGNAYLPVFWSIPTETLSPAAAATGVGLINALGSIAGFAGPYAFGYLYNRAGSISSGLVLMMLTALASGLLILRVAKPRHAPPQPN